MAQISFKGRQFSQDMMLQSVRWYLAYALSYRNIEELMDETYIKVKGQCKYVNNVVEQDHRRINRLTRPMIGFKNFHCAQRTLAGIEVVAMIKKGQMLNKAGDERSSTELFYSLAA